MAREHGYMPQLDGLRAFAVACVLVFHWFAPPFALGLWGVTLFFVLSGYLITKNIAALRAGGLPLTAAASRFFLRRTLRLFPAFYLVVFVAALLYDDVRRDWLWYAAYLSNILFELHPHRGVLQPSWSLAVEEQFYIVWFFVAMMVPARRLAWIIAIGVLVGPLTRCAWLLPDHPALRTWTLWAHCDGLLLGALLSRLESAGRELPLSRYAVLAMAAGLAALSVAISPQAACYTAVAGVLVAAISAWLVWHARRPLQGLAGRVLSNRRVVQLGRISYGIYLYHMITPGLVDWLGLPRLPLIWRLFQPGSLPGFATHCAVTVALAALSFRYVEMPLRRLARPAR